MKRGFINLILATVLMWTGTLSVRATGQECDIMYMGAVGVAGKSDWLG